MLSRFVKFQLVTFSILSVIGMIVMATVYMRLPTLVGVGTMTVYVDLPASGGLYRFGNVTYRGVEIGKVTAVGLTRDGVRATLAIDGSHDIPVDLEAQVRSVSAVGEQYVDLRPRVDGGPYLHDGSVIDMTDTKIPQAVGPMLDRLSALVGTIPTEKLHALLDELFKSVNGAGYEMNSLLTSAETLSARLDEVSGETAGLVRDAEPLLGSQAESLDAIQIWTRSLAGVTGQLVTDDPQVRTLLQTGPGFAGEARKLFESVELTLPVLLANLSSIGQLAVTYNAGLEQTLVLLPPSISMIQAVQPNRNASGLGLGTFRFGGISDPPACTVGFLPPTAWRSPEDTTTIDTPDGLYCKLPQDSGIAVRGARNIPCAAVPGKRAATAEECNSDKQFEPVATDQPLIGPYPRDPGLESQGVPPDARPVPSASTGGSSPGTATPASFGAANYDPRTGNYLGSDGKLYQQGDLVTPSSNRPWTSMMPH
ncbi:MCE family protein [Nocardia bovistercoris]|uniref:MCE family protein n=1 Tax=Nocardia bovistercoris TaxID=2785916 RepID=A0A931IK54_9NOCA|nr:MlaD family protein [Nocardia bovistercoris]MBH0781120.1 MCE family protein [Nocardia bovistercoris]